MLGILLVDKPKGITSHDVIYLARRKLGIRKIGHAGTLDPMATGLLVLAVGDATRFLRYLSMEPKVYEGEITLGVRTTTQDAEGEVLTNVDASNLRETEIIAAAANFIGEIMQQPPMYSAVKIGGERLYKLARRGIEVERPHRRTTVFEFELWQRGDALTFRVVCSGGTYIRTLASDLGELLGVGAHLSALRRISCGGFSVNDAAEPAKLSDSHLIPLERALQPMPIIALDEQEAKRAKTGAMLALDAPECEVVGLIADSRFLGVARRQGEFWHPECVAAGTVK